MTVDQFRDIRAKAGGLIILLPDNLSRLSAEQRQVCCIRYHSCNNWIYNKHTLAERIQLEQ